MRGQPPELDVVRLHVTGADLAGRPTSKEEVLEALGELSAWDCLRLVGRLSASLYLAESQLDRRLQRELIDKVTWPAPDLRQRLHHLLSRGRVPFFQQQLYHLARLAVLHASDREPDDFRNGEDLGKFFLGLFGVTDLFDAELGDKPNREQVLSWALRQAAINHDEERLTLWSMYYEVFHEIWPSLGGSTDPEDAFQRYTGISILDFLTIGFALGVGLGQETDAGAPRGQIQPAEWFGEGKLEKAKWEAFLAASAGDLQDLREAIKGEQDERGEVPFRSLAMERRPLVSGPDGLCYVLNLPSLEWRSTHGIFHILAEGAVDEGFDRELYTAPFGRAFQIWAEGCIRRAEKAAQGEAAQIFADVPYGPKGQRRDTPDVVVRDERQIAVVEVVAGPLQSKTVTHGDLDAFERDLDKLIFKKAKQLTDRIADIERGDAAEIGLDAEGVGRIWPVIVTAAPFPVWTPVMREIRARLKRAGFLQSKRTGPICVISGEELAAAESEMEQTKIPFVALLAEWKSRPQTGDLWLKNFLVHRAKGREGGAPSPRHHKEMWRRASREMFMRLFGHPGPDVSEADEGIAA